MVIQMRVGFASVSVGLIASVLAHLVLLIAVAVPYQRQTVHGETLSVDLVSPEEAAPAFKDQPSPEVAQPSPQAEAQPDWSKLRSPTPSLDQSQVTSDQAARQQSAPSQSAQRPSQAAPPSQQVRPPAQQAEQRASLPTPPAQSPSAQSPAAQSPPAQTSDRPPLVPELQTPETLAEQGSRLAAMLGLPPPGQSGAEEKASKADIDSDAAVAFKEHLKTCWSPPAAVAAQKARLLMRVAFRRDGTLAGPPEMIGGSPTGPLLKDAAVQALRRCEPFTMLPQAKYEEWRVLDLTFPPDQVAGP